MKMFGVAVVGLWLFLHACTSMGGHDGAGRRAASSATEQESPLSMAESRDLVSIYRARVRSDSELSAFVLKISEAEFRPQRIRPEALYYISIVIDGKRLADLSAAQRDRVLAKAAFQLRAVVEDAQRRVAKKIEFGVFFNDDLGRAITVYRVSADAADPV